MNSFPSLSTLVLPARAMHSLDHAAGLQLTCQEGCLWITLDHDPRDIVLETGQSFTVPDQRRAILYALEGSRLTLRTPPAQVRPATPAPTRARSLQARLGT